MSDARNLNFEAIDCMKESGFDADYILESLVKALDAYTVNDMFAYIYRVHDFTEDNPEAERIEAELKAYEKEEAANWWHHILKDVKISVTIPWLLALME